MHADTQQVRISFSSSIVRMLRREEWLTAAVPDEGAAQADPEPVQAGTGDKYGLDLNEFKMKTGRKPREFKKCVRFAEWNSEGRAKFVHHAGFSYIFPQVGVSFFLLRQDPYR